MVIISLQKSKKERDMGSEKQSGECQVSASGGLACRCAGWLLPLFLKGLEAQDMEQLGRPWPGPDHRLWSLVPGALGKRHPSRGTGGVGVVCSGWLPFTGWYRDVSGLP